MNFYFLLEDEKSFLKVLPYWLEHMGFACRRVADIQAVEENNYVLQSGQGVTQLVTKALFDTIDTILLHPGKIDKLVVILDAEELDAEDRKEEVEEKIRSHYQNVELRFGIVILVCNRCFETWLLGCQGLYPIEEVEEESYFYPYYSYYNTGEQDPEEMVAPENINETTAKYHFHYLHELLRYKKIRYTKKKPDYVATETYFRGIVGRIGTTGHLKSFKGFYDFISDII
ncbi:MAG: hypothetical protein HFH38_07075 [Lachnospiraceae bacterium]|jgi:hypothetical protein|nr:hypothetical protein [Lachnospiraceae bacterium]